ncbi:MAG TPA: DUF1559 domain-containing protein, partial [Nitrospiraceae bacterium]
MLPALSRAKEQSRRAVCSSNLKQIGLAMQMYLQDYNDTYPPAWLVPGNYGQGFWVGKAGSVGTGYENFGADVRYLNRYFGTPFQSTYEVPVAHCASDNRPLSCLATNKTGYDYVGASYGSNTHPTLNTL